MEQELCKICLEVISDHKFKPVKEFDKNILESLIPLTISTLDVSSEPKLCEKCSNSLHTWYYLKTQWLENSKRRKMLIPVGNCSESSEISCCLCEQITVEEMCSEDMKIWKEMVICCVPEWDIHAVDNVCACRECMNTLKNLYVFVNTVLIKGDIKNNCLKEDKPDLISLRDILKFYKSETKNKTVPEEKQEGESGLKHLDVDTQLNSEDNVVEEPIVVQDEEPSRDVTEERGYPVDHLTSIINDIEAGAYGTLVQEHPTPEQQESNEDDEEQSKTESEEEFTPQHINASGTSDSEDSAKKKRSKPTRKKTRVSKQFRCDKCSFVAKYKSALVNHQRVHRDPPEKVIYKCNACDYETNRKPDLKAHVITHRDPSQLQKKSRRKRPSSPREIKCDQCDYVTKYRSALVSHLMVHKDPSETTMHKCTECGHETKRIADLRAHMIIHRDPSELKKFKCLHCAYESKRKGDLKNHMMTHQTVKYKCELCTYETANKRYLEKVHAVIHKERSEVRLYKCDKCQFECPRKNYMVLHANLHKAKDEVPVYKCHWCDFETRYKTSLRLHMVLHKCSSEIQMFECHECGYKTKRKKDLKLHVTRHFNFKKESLRCANCPFETKDKRCLIYHMNVHRDISELRTFKCHLCSYQSVRKGNLQSHLKSHGRLVQRKNVFEISSDEEPRRSRPPKPSLNEEYVVFNDIGMMEVI